MIYQKLLEGLKEAVKRAGTIHSIDPYMGVDFALFDKQGPMIQNPLSYRNSIGQRFWNRCQMSREHSLFRQTGIPFAIKINSVNMIME